MHKLPIKVITPERTSLVQFFKDFVKYRNLFALLFWRDINVRYRQTVIGLFWVILQPIVSAAIFAFVFGRLVHIPSDGLPYVVFAYSGTVIWGLFSQGVDRAAGSILADEQMITKVYFPRWILPLASVGGTFLDFSVSAVVLFLITFYFQLYPGWHILLFVPAVGLVLALTASVGTSVAMLCAKYRDFRFLANFCLQVFVFASPVFYTLGMFHQNTLWVAYLNPLAGPIELFRLGVIGTGHFYPLGFMLSLTMELLVLLIGLRIVYELEDDLIDTI